MSRQLRSDSSLETLKKEAKRWLKALRAGDARARERWHAVMGAAPAHPGLREIQLALARELGFAGWTALRQALDDLALARQSQAERAGIVLRSASWNGDKIAATRILARWPETGAHDLYTAVVTGNLEQVERRLAADPAAARRQGGPLECEPLLYLAYGRLSGSAADDVAIATALLDRGADPNVRSMDEWKNPFTALTGVIGQGEGDKLPHPRARELASTLIARGADPFDTQALYNTSITRDDVTWLDFLWNESAKRGRLEAWRAGPDEHGIGGILAVSALNYLLGNAVAYNHLRRAEWLLQHGADPNGPHAYSKRPQREEALVYGHREMADLLVRFGAEQRPLQGRTAFQAACMQLDREEARTLAQAHPECLEDAGTMLTAARAGRADVVSLLLELGTHVDVADHTRLRGLQAAVAAGSLEIVKLLVAHEADIDRPTIHYGGAMGFAAHFGRREIAAFLAPLSRDVLNLTHLGMTERLRELFAEDAALVNAPHVRSGATPLFALPDDEDEAVGIAAFLLAHGADPHAKNHAGVTAEQFARQRGLIDAADLMTDE
jgi:ankyrin repeat protein